jgi:hypothetical protein
MDKKQLKKLRRLLKRASPGPWVEDDCNVFSEPLSQKRDEIIDQRLNGSDEPHPDPDYGDPMGWVCTTHQLRNNADADAELIVMLRNLIPTLLDDIEELQQLKINADQKHIK